ncbi:hypothetical protein [Hahella sp. HN01]|uniref:hypothetical protein n=1 Tax=Hahella sp. HN01 TaxID=2847262 RepID=UPI001C1EEDE3|nr:hypothetical protein [Hahella sp. HN01]MBU6952749.1 hypothetical protein [Hahella sp. HN01]
MQKRKGGRTSIGVSPSAADYPKNIGFGRGYHQKIGYNRIGQTIIDRINVLHKSLYKAESKFIDSGYLGETMNKEIILRAESLLSKIGDRSDIYRQKYAPLIVDKRIQKIA